MSYRVTTKGFDVAQKMLNGLPRAVQRASVDSVNTTTRFGYAEASRGIRAQIAVPQPYIGSAQSGNRLRVSRWAKPGQAEAVIAASHRATSLARFALDRTVVRRPRGGVRVRVRAGSARRIASAFLLRLRKGASLTQDGYNIGLALRLKKGAPVRNKRQMVQYGGGDQNLYLLYGPSVYQVFRGVSGAIEPKVSRRLQTEFLRQLGRHI